VEWHRVDTKLLSDRDFACATSAQVATWLRLVLYCAIHENQGRIQGARRLDSPSWIRMVGVAKDAVFSAVDGRLAAWDKDDLLVRWYDLAGQRRCEANRMVASHGGLKAKQNRYLAANAGANATANTTANAGTRTNGRTNVQGLELCTFHAKWTNQNRAAPVPISSCHECRHVAAMSATRPGGTKAIADVIAKSRLTPRS
jgi:hypothetical protein